MRWASTRLLCMLGLIVVVCSGRAGADAFRWINSFGGGFSSSSNWAVIPPDVGSPPPGIGDTALFDLNATYDVTLLSGSTAIDGFNLTAGTVTLRGGFALCNCSLDIATGAANANVNGGTLVLGETSLPVAFNVGNVLTVGSGTVLAFSDGSSITAAQGVTLGLSGGSGTLTIGNAIGGTVTADLATSGGFVDIGVSGNNATVGTLEVSTYSSVTIGNTRIATNTSGATGNLNVTGGTLMQAVGATLTTGSASGGAGTINLDGGTFTTSTSASAITVDAAGQLNIDGGTLHALGGVQIAGTPNLSLTSGLLHVDGSDFATAGSILYGGASLILPEFRVTNGGDASYLFSFVVGNNASTEGVATVSGVSGGERSTVRATGGGGGADIIIGNNGIGTADVLDGGFMSTGDDLFVGRNTGGSGVLNVSGVNGGFRSTVDVTHNNSLNSFIYIGGGQSSTAGFGQLNVTSGALVEASGSMSVGESTNALGIVTVGTASGGFDAEIRITNDLTVGGTTSAAGGTGQVNINAGGLVDVGDTVVIWLNGGVSVNGGTLRARDFVFNSAALNFLSGSVIFNGDVTLDATKRDLILGAGQPIDAGRTLGSDGLLTLNDPLTINGGELRIFDINDIDQVTFTSGTLKLTAPTLTVGAGGMLGAAVSAKPTQTIHNTGQSVVVAGGTLHAAEPSGFGGGTDGVYIADGLITVQNGGQVTNTGVYTINGGVHVLNGGVFENSVINDFIFGTRTGFMQLAGDITVDPGGTFRLESLVDLIGPGTWIGTIDNQSSIGLADQTLTIGDGTLATTGGEFFGRGEIAGSTANSVLDLGTGILRTGTGTMTVRDLQVQGDTVVQLKALGAIELAGVTTVVNPSVPDLSGGMVLIDGDDVTLVGTIDNDGLIRFTDTLTVPAAGWSLTGTGDMNGLGRLISVGFPPSLSAIPSVLTGEPGAVITNSGNTIQGGPFVFQDKLLEIRDLTIDNSAGGAIGENTRLQGVTLIGGTIGPGFVFAEPHPTLANPVSLQGNIAVTGILIAEDAVVPSGSQLSVAAGGQVFFRGLNVQGHFRADPGGAVIVESGETADFTQGTYSLGDDTAHDLDLASTVLVPGTLTFDDLAIDNTSTGFMRYYFGADPVLGPGEAVVVLGMTSFISGLNLSGGSLTSARLDQASSALLNWTSGALTLTTGNLHVGSGSGDDFFLGQSATVPAGGTLTVPGEAVVGLLALTGEGSLSLGSGAVLNTGPAQRTTIGAFGSINLDNATVNTDRIDLLLGGELTGSGDVNARIITQSGSTITATGNLAIGDASLPNAVTLAGDLFVQAGTTTLHDANDAVLDSGAFVALDDGAGGNATLAAPNGLTLDFGGNITGFGTVNTPDDPFKLFINNGNISGNSGAEPVSLTGYVKGVGTLDNVVITGTDAPGFSPATVYRGSVTYAGTLEIELGGTAVGSFDRIIHSGTATLGGTLDVLLINGFTPSFGDSFDILDFGSITGGFNAINLPALGGDLEWDTSNLIIDGTLAVVSTALTGDLNGDGFVGIADLNIVLGNWNQTIPPGDPLADPSGDNFVGIADLNVVLGNWNAGTPPAGQANIPEPATLTLGAAAALALVRRHSA